MSILTRMGKCGECKWYKPEPKMMRECAPYHFDGLCLNRKHTVNGKLYRAYSRAAACFDAEDPDGQMTIEEVLA